MSRIFGTVHSFLLICLCNFTFAGEIEITDVVIREAPPGATIMAAYMTLSNRSGDLVTLTNIESEDFKRIEIHQSMIANGQSSMKHFKTLEIPADTRVQLKPGAFHLMLFNPARSLKEGDICQLELLFLMGKSSLPMPEL